MKHLIVNFLALASVLLLGCSSPTVPCEGDDCVVEPGRVPVTETNPSTPSNGGSIDCSAHDVWRCSYVKSYAEALYVLNHCPNTAMDGNNDGEPCEQQFKK